MRSFACNNGLPGVRRHHSEVFCDIIMGFLRNRLKSYY